MESSDYQADPSQAAPGTLYFAGLALFITASAALSVWAFVTLAVAK